jgi:ribonuclease HI
LENICQKAGENQDLWISLDKALTRHDVEWHWVKGHSGVAGNEHADSLANQAIDELLNADK